MTIQNTNNSINYLYVFLLKGSKFHLHMVSAVIQTFIEHHISPYIAYLVLTVIIQLTVTV